MDESTTNTAVTQDASADNSESLSTAAKSEQDTANADAASPESQSTAVEGVEDVEEEEENQTTDQESAEGDTEGEKGHKKTLNERVKELAAKEVAEALAKERVEREAIEQQTKERLKAEEKTFVELSETQVIELNESYAAAISQVAELHELIRLGDKSPETIVQLRKAEKWIRDTEAWYADNETKKSEWEAKTAERTKAQTEIADRSKRLQTTSDVFRESKGIPQDVWDQGSKQFYEVLQADKVVAMEFAEAYRLKGDVGAVKFAYEWMESRGEEAKKANTSRDKAKDNSLGGKSQTTAGAVTVKTWSDYDKLPGKQQIAWAEKNPKAFDRILEEKRKKAS